MDPSCGQLPNPHMYIVGKDILSNKIVYKIANQRQYHIPKETIVFSTINKLGGAGVVIPTILPSNVPCR